MSDAARIRALEDEIDTLREAVRQAKDLLAGGGDIVWPAALNLTPAQGRCLGALLCGQLVTEYRLNAAGCVDGVFYEGSSNLASSRICTIRKKIADFGVEIRTIWGQGWILEGESRAQVRAWAATGRIDARPEDIAPDADAPRVAGVRA